MSGLSDREAAFCQAYILHGNGSAAARALGIENAETAKKTAQRYLKKPAVQAYIGELQGAAFHVASRSRRVQGDMSTIQHEGTGDIAGDTHPIVPVEVRERIAVAQAAYVMQGLIDNAEISLGRKPVTVTVPVGKKRVNAAVYKHDGASANRALELLGKSVGFVPADEAAPTIEGELAEEHPAARAARDWREKHGLPPPPADFDPTKE